MIINPLVTWMWIGGLIALAGAAIALWPSRGRRRRLRPSHGGRCDQGGQVPRDPRRRVDHAAGKLSDEDYALLDAELRREAVEILDRIEANGNGNGNGHRRDREPVA